MTDWLRFLRVLAATAGGTAAALFLFVALADPYDSLPLSLPLDRLPATSNQRFAYAALARDRAFDSAVIGTSTVRLLDPARLDPLFGATFANLAMNSATAWEQRSMIEVFLASHPRARILMIGVDDVWCWPEEESPRFGPRPFPPWLYDDNPWNDYLYLFNLEAIEDAGRALSIALRRRAPKFGADGYASFLPDPSKYDLARAMKNLYGDAGPPPVPDTTPVATVEPTDRAQWLFPDLRHLRAALAAAPADTEKILFFVPYHVGTRNWPLTRQGMIRDACKAAVSEIAAETPRTVVLDFMLPSAITRRDENYWDILHYSEEVALLLADLIHRAAEDGREDADHYRILWPR